MDRDQKRKPNMLAVAIVCVGLIVVTVSAVFSARFWSLVNEVIP